MRMATMGLKSIPMEEGRTVRMGWSTGSTTVWSRRTSSLREPGWNQESRLAMTMR